MADIYEGALITIAAVCGSDSTQGLYPLRDDFKPHRLKHSNLHMRKHIGENTDQAAVFDKLVSPLLTRAWVYQERRISTRVLYFSAYQLVFECKTGYWAENGVYPQLHGNSTSSQDLSRRAFEPGFQSPIQSWHHAVARYSRLQLSFERDRLPAVAALAYRMMGVREYKDVYLAGLWRDSFLEDLCWQVRTTDPRQIADRHLPSWSWATHRGSVDYPFTRLERIAESDFVDVDCKFLGPRHLGDVENAVVTLRAPFFHLKVDPASEPGWRRSFIPGVASHFFEKLDFVMLGDQSLSDARGLEVGVPPGDDEVFTACILCKDCKGKLKFYMGKGTEAGRDSTLHGIILRKTGVGRFTRFGSVSILPAASFDDDMRRSGMTAYIDDFIKTLPVVDFYVV